MDMYTIVGNIFSPVIMIIKTVVFTVLFLALMIVVLFFLGFFLRYHINPFKLNAKKLIALDIRFKLYDLFRWLLVDIFTSNDRKNEFDKFGFTIFCGRQGAGKTMAMVQQLNEIKKQFPKCIIVTNFKYEHADHIMKDWKDFFEIRNGTEGVVFAIDEIQSEYSAESWKDFPETILSEISMQRKQRIKIYATSQVFSRVVKQIREQTFSVVMCNTYLHRWTFCKEYDAAEYSTADTPYTLKSKCKPIFRWSFVQSNSLRACYDTYEKIERLKKTEFIKRNER